MLIYAGLIASCLTALHAVDLQERIGQIHPQNPSTVAFSRSADGGFNANLSTQERPWQESPPVDSYSTHHSHQQHPPHETNWNTAWFPPLHIPNPAHHSDSNTNPFRNPYDKPQSAANADSFRNFPVATPPQASTYNFTPRASDTPNSYSEVMQRLMAEPGVQAGFLDRINTINISAFTPARPPLVYMRDLRLLQLAYPHVAHTPPSNILHVGADSGFVPLALVVMAAGKSTVTSVDENAQMLAEARENVLRDGKGFFLGLSGAVARLRFHQLTLHGPSSIPPPPNNASQYDVIVLSRALHDPLPLSLRRMLRPGGIVVYQFESVAERTLHQDRLLQDGNFETERKIHPHI